MTRAVVYTRFSPRPDAATSESCGVQRSLCAEHAARAGYSVAAVFDDPDRSGADEFRPQLWAAIEALPRGGVLLVYKRDRLARNVYLAEQIARAVAKRGARIEAVSGDVAGDAPEAVMVRQIVAAMAEYERKLISARTSASMKRLQASGRRMSAIPPYGWRVDPGDARRLVPDGTEQAVLALMRRMRADGMGARRIAAALDPAAARCGRWSPSVVRRILARR